MATRAKTKRTLVVPTKKVSARKKVDSVSTDDVTQRLASTLASSLTISNSKGVGTEHSGAPESIQDRRISVMRAVNMASQGLTAVMKSGWKAPSGEPSKKKSTATLHEAFGLAASARSRLGDLRVVSPGDADVERAAISVAGKLLSLDLYSHALDVLSDMHCRLVVLVRPDLTPPISRPSSQMSPPPRDVIAIISLPLPSQSSKPLDPTLLLLIITYLSHSLIALSHCLDSSSSKPIQRETLVLYSQALHDSPSLLRWIPLCTQLPAKQCDVLLTRAYTALMSISTQASGAADAIFRIRSYALMCLLRTSGSTVGSKTFWDQVIKSASSFARSASSNDKAEQRRLCRVVTSAFSEILALVEERGNKDEFLHGMPFISFCDAWISYSKSADDVAALSKVIALVQSSPSTSYADRDEEKLLNVLSNLNLDDAAKGKGRDQVSEFPSRKDKDKIEPTEVAHITKLCASFARTTTLIAGLGQRDGAEEGVLSNIRETNEHVKEARAVRPPLEAQDDYKLAKSKMRRALDRLKRAAIKVIDAPEDMRLLADGVVKAVRILLVDIATTMEALLSADQESVSEDYASLLDLFFVLARTTLTPNNPVLTDTAYDLLFRSARLLGFQLTNDNEYPHTISPPPSVAEESFANFVRCLSGAFHSLGGTLYQSGKYGSAIRFLRRGCALGVVALRLRRNCDSKSLGNTQEQQQAAGGKETESWEQLHDQLSRRWELLGVCCSKIGDRQGAYEAFIECLGSYVFPRTFVELVRTIGPTSAFEAAPSLKQAAVIIDRVTYMASCELLRPPAEVSLKRLINSISIGGADNHEEDRRCVVGAILERQVDHLAGSLWKPNVQNAVAGLLSDCVSTYDAENRPIRRAGVMLRILELSYYTGAPGGDVQLEESAEEIKALLSLENVGRDSTLTHLSALHRAEMHMWLALHAYRQVHPQQYPLIIQHAQEAYRVLRRWLHGTPMETAQVKESPKQVRTARKAKGKTASVRAVAAATRKPKASKVAPSTPKRPRRSDPSHEAGTLATSKVEKDVALMRKSSRRIVSLMNMTIHLVGFIGHVILKLELLQVARQVCEHPSIGQHDDFVQLSVQLAHEYVKLGKLREAGGVYKRSLNPTQVQTVSSDTRVVLLLRHAESLTKIGDVGQSFALYNEALQLSENLPMNEGESSTLDRVHSHVTRLRRAALAASVFAGIKLAQDDLTQSVTSLLQAIRLWHRAVSTLSHLSSREGPASSSTLSNPFDVSSDSGKASPTKDESQSSTGSIAVLHYARAFTDGLEWQIAEGMFETTLSLASAYLRRGSVREAEYFIREAEQLASSLNAPALLCRALTMKVEVQLQLRQLDTAQTTLRTATDTLNNIAGPDAAGLRKLHGEYNELLLQNKDAQLQYTEALKMLEELDKMFPGLDSHNRRSSNSISSPLRSKESLEPPAPALFSAVLRQHIWLLRNEIGDEYESLLHKLSQLAPLADIQAEERSLLARLTLHDVYEHFQEDMFLSSIRESVLSLPMGASEDKYLLTTTSAQVIMRTLTDAGKLFHSVLTSTARCGSVPRVREAASSLALIQSFQSSLGENDSSLLVANLLDVCANVTLRREILEVISYKLPSKNRDDLRWPLLSADGARLVSSSRRINERELSPINLEDDDDEQSEDLLLAEYWEFIRSKYQELPLDLADLACSKVDILPANWTVVHIYLTEDQNTMFVCRQRANQRPLIFSLPLKGRRETEEDEHLTFQDAIAELREIVRLSDESTKSAISVKGQDQRARAAWWADRTALDKRLKELLDSIEFCWFGAFKTVLSEQVTIPQEAMSAFRNRLDRIFAQTIGAQGKKQSIHMHVNPALLECFSRLSPKCRDEELEDLVYFILDLYQFHGVQVAIAEVDVDHVLVDLRTALEEHAARVRGRSSSQEDEHVFLVLNRCLQEIPWESLPILRGRSVSRIPNVDFLIDRLEFAQRRRQSARRDSDHYDGHTRLDSSSTYYVLNPSGDLEGTERRFSPWLRSMHAVGWDGIIGRSPSEQEFSHALLKNELVIYFGHGGGEQYIRSHKIRHLPRCAATMLWGCSSGLLRDMGEFDRIGTPYNYMLAGCPTLIANLWDVTDRDIDKLTQAVFDKMRLTPEARREKSNESETDGISIVRALAEAREVCKLKYITGAAPVVYGIPFYL